MRVQFSNQLVEGAIKPEAANKDYVDTQLALKINKSGDAMVGPLILASDPTNPYQAATKQYVDSKANSSVIPVGSLIYMVTSAPAPIGYLPANGASVSKITYSGLYAAIGDAYTAHINPGNGKPWKQQYYINTNQSGDITGWITGVNLPENLSQSQAVVTKNRVYLLGGYSDSGRVSTVYTAPINSDGTLGAWTTVASLPSALSMSQAVVTKNRVYLLGGLGGSNWVSTVYTAPINSDGTLGAWTTETSLPVALAESQAIVTNSQVYLLGGYTGSGWVSTVYTASINSDGTLGDWTTATSLPVALAFSQAIVTNSQVYLLGGVSGTGATVSTVYTAPINSDGTLGDWVTGDSLYKALSNSQAIVTKSSVYLLGGNDNGGNAISTVYTAPINSDGTLGTWNTGTSLPGPLGYSQAIVTKNRVYLLGGRDNGGNTSTVYTASILDGLNDYSAYYSGGISNNFNVPNIPSTDPANYIVYIKY